MSLGKLKYKLSFSFDKHSIIIDQQHCIFCQKTNISLRKPDVSYLLWPMNLPHASSNLISLFLWLVQNISMQFPNTQNYQ